MPADLQFTPAHVSSIAARAAELERIGEETQDPQALVRAARLYALAVRIVDDIESREALPFMTAPTTCGGRACLIVSSSLAPRWTTPSDPSRSRSTW